MALLTWNAGVSSLFCLSLQHSPPVQFDKCVGRNQDYQQQKKSSNHIVIIVVLEIISFVVSAWCLLAADVYTEFQNTVSKTMTN